MTRRTVALADLAPLAAEEPGKADSVGAGALDTEGDQLAMRPGVADGRWAASPAPELSDRKRLLAGLT